MKIQMKLNNISTWWEFKNYIKINNRKIFKLRNIVYQYILKKYNIKLNKLDRLCCELYDNFDDNGSIISEPNLKKLHINFEDFAEYNHLKIISNHIKYHITEEQFEVLEKFIYQSRHVISTYDINNGFVYDLYCQLPNFNLFKIKIKLIVDSDNFFCISFSLFENCEKYTEFIYRFSSREFIINKN